MSSIMLPACSLQGVLASPGDYSVFFLSLQGDIRSPSTSRHPRHTRPATHTMLAAFRDLFSNLALMTTLAVPRWAVAVEGPRSGTLMDTCLALVPITALTFSEAEVALCKSISCKWCQDQPPPVHGRPSVSCLCSLSSTPLCPVSLWKGMVGTDSCAWCLWFGQSPVPVG